MLKKRKVELDAVMCRLQVCLALCLVIFHLCVFTVSEKGTWVFICCCSVSSFEASNIQAIQTFLTFQIFARLKQHPDSSILLKFCIYNI